MAHVDNVIAAFAAAHELATTSLNEDGCLTMPLPCGIDMMLSYLPSDDALVLYCELGEPMRDTGSIYRLLLEGMHVWRASGGVTFGLVPETEVISASLLLPLSDRFDATALAAAIEHFDSVVATWSDIVQETNYDLSGDAAPSDDDADPREPLIKV